MATDTSFERMRLFYGGLRCKYLAANERCPYRSHHSLDVDDELVTGGERRLGSRRMDDHALCSHEGSKSGENESALHLVWPVRGM